MVEQYEVYWVELEERSEDSMIYWLPFCGTACK